ncbi:MAG: hypothetical protein V4616_15210 [Bacteroidota bacterium]
MKLFIFVLVAAGTYYNYFGKQEIEMEPETEYSNVIPVRKDPDGSIHDSIIHERSIQEINFLMSESDKVINRNFK